MDEVDINSAMKALSVSLEESDTRQDTNEPVKSSWNSESEKEKLICQKTK